MARGKTTPEGSSYGYFKQLFTKRPELLNGKKNAEILAQYRADHGLEEDAVIDKPDLNNMNTLKSVMRKKARQTATTKAAATGIPRVRSANRLEELEELIDDCLTMARNHDREGLKEIIFLLRRARNKVVWRMGEK